ncbi:MurR/RpiR family transcriptional regulator [Labrys wisconsinensis]|uniref:DNA-binding MurR/RpiR family transcriptional regulator n=1 Tax=Labrys wisconsinensis TaxID=425677 RepID=A0ABU0JA16_9HYPH|nr:MurR/RpiR family transcriptional regulator [Labrys wisconsinensis]MDQ0471098.1 DNA-binding MurR/RpiR family transcriptional regulator [Labrys wisconsinensis]
MSSEGKILQAPPDDGATAAIDIFQKLVAAARSRDRTMAGLSQWIIANQDRAAGLSISSLAQQTGVSETTVFRFCKLLGLNGYKDLRFALAESRGLALGAQLAGLPGGGEGATEHPMASIMRRVVEVNSEQLLKTMSLVSLSALEQATEALLAANHIHLVGFGSSAPVAFDAYQRLLCLGLTASAHSDPHVLAAVTANARPGALFFGITCSGRTRDVIEAFETAGTRGLKRIVITSDEKAPVTKVADIVLISAVRRSPIAREVIATRISQLAIVETICVALALNHSDAHEIVHDTALLEQEIAKKRLPERAPPAEPT